VNGEVEIRHSATPPSLNAVGSRGHWREFHQAKREWQTIFEQLLIGSSLPRGCTQVGAGARLTFKVERRRDEGNFRTLIEKSLGDALVNGGWLPDDTPDYFRMGPVVLEKGDRAATIVVLYYER
jgi:hypothetical protein